jgi:hypothetical protein
MGTRLILSAENTASLSSVIPLTHRNLRRMSMVDTAKVGGVLCHTRAAKFPLSVTT